MAGIDAGGGKGRKRGFNDNLNLVPFVDLFSTLIIFLISTAVWDDLAAVQVNLGAQDKPSIETPKQDLKKVTSDVKITVSDHGIETFEQGKTNRIEKIDGKLDVQALDQFVTDIRAKYSDKKDMLIFATDAAAYEDLIAVMDKCLAKNFDELIVTGAEQKN